MYVWTHHAEDTEIISNITVHTQNGRQCMNAVRRKYKMSLPEKVDELMKWKYMGEARNTLFCAGRQDKPH
jgi:hypothetical protein